MSLLLCPNATCQEAALRHSLTGWCEPIPHTPQTIKEVACDPHQVINFPSNSQLPGREHPEASFFRVCPDLWAEGVRSGSGLGAAAGRCWTAPSGQGRLSSHTQPGTQPPCQPASRVHSALNNAHVQHWSFYLFEKKKSKPKQQPNNKDTWS